MYSKLYFNKDLQDITKNDVDHFFENEREESDTLEFKSFSDRDQRNAKESEFGILRTIDAFLNSNGGILIWGAPMESLDASLSPGKKRKIYKGTDYGIVKIFYEKDSFISKCITRITPAPINLHFKRIEVSDGYLYLIEVNKSPYAPHQFDNTYYMRLDGQTIPAPHHYIEALFKRITFPVLHGVLTIKAITFNANTYMKVRTIPYPHYLIEFLFKISNKSKLQNEHEIYYQLYTNAGHFQSCTLNNETSFFESPLITNASACHTLFFNKALVGGATIVISEEELMGLVDEPFSIVLHFGGKRSPLLMSLYEVNVKATNSADWVMRKEENIYMHDLGDLQEPPSK